MIKKLSLAILPTLFAAILLACSSFNGIQKVPTETVQYDGPYVLYKNNVVFVKYVFDDGGIKSVKVDSFPAAQRSAISLTVNTDIPGKTFTVQLKPELKSEPTETSKVNKLLILSDIEGNFKALRKLFQANGVMDENFNWTFGDGQVELTGDFFDRGDQVTEVLWLIYSLEEKAKAAGGYLHFVLGNHEIMNLSGDLRYVHPKYKEDAALMNEDFMALYSENSELGRWLRTKNIMEKIGDILFMHGGISAEMNSMEMSLSKVNKLAKPFYADSTYKYKDPKLILIYSDLGPFWYRGYYQGEKAGDQQIDNTLALYGVKHIATGHTIIADTISVLHGGKLFNTDVHHAKGLSEALLMENGKFYRVNGLGEKFLVLE